VLINLELSIAFTAMELGLHK